MRLMSFVLLALTSGCAFFWETPGTPLARAAHQGDLDQIKALVAAGADPNEYDPARPPSTGPRAAATLSGHTGVTAKRPGVAR